ncbi:hypothetical protein HMI56_005537 [Coelomomyces lativittatus]|nr:hypothetical protein HMI56_005537 [Coelomomyces lativittatus]
MNRFNRWIYPLTVWLSQLAIRLSFIVITVDEAHVPKQGPGLLACSHSNMIIDPAILLTTSPYHRQIHFWAKASIWKSKVFGFIFDGLGGVPVRRKLDEIGTSAGKYNNNEHLWKSTLHVLKSGELVGIFPEGTSYTLPHHIVLRDGLAKAAIEYSKLSIEHGFPPAPILPIGITYLEKEKYRTIAIVMFGEPIYVEPFVDLPPSTLTKYIESSLREITINAPDWHTFHAARIARKLLIPYEALELDQFVSINQAFITVFSNLQHHPTVQPLYKCILAYSLNLRSSGLQDDIAMYPSSSRWTHPLLLKTITTIFTKGTLVLPSLFFLWPLFLIRYYFGRQDTYVESYSQTRCLTIMVGVPLLVLGCMWVGYLVGQFFMVTVSLVFWGGLFIHLIDDVMMALDRLPSFKNWGHHSKLVHERVKAFQQLKTTLEALHVSEKEFQEMAYGPFQPCRSVFEGSIYPEPQHSLFQKVEYKQLIFAIKNIQKQLKRVIEEWKLLDENGRILKSTLCPYPQLYPSGENRSWIYGQRVLTRECI